MRVARGGPTVASIAIAILIPTACAEPDHAWTVDGFEVTDADLLTVVNGLAGGRSSTVLITRESGPVPLATGLPPQQTIRDIAACSATDCLDIAVGDNGLVARGTNAAPWEPVDFGLTAELRAVTRTMDYVALVGEQTLRVWYEPEGPSSWFDPAPPDAQGWGSLRDIFGPVIVGDGGRVFVSDDMHEWRREDPGVSVDLLALGFHDPDPLDAEPGRLWAVGAGGTAIVREGEGLWSVVDLALDDDLLAFSEGFVLTGAATLLQIDGAGAVTLIDRFDRQPRALLARAYAQATILVVGDGGLYRSYSGPARD